MEKYTEGMSEPLTFEKIALVIRFAGLTQKTDLLPKVEK